MIRMPLTLLSVVAATLLFGATASQAAPKNAPVNCATVASVNNTTTYVCKGNVVFVFIKNSDVWLEGFWKVTSVTPATRVVVVKNVATGKVITVTPNSKYGFEKP
jgi:hypothetical protein